MKIDFKWNKRKQEPKKRLSRYVLCTVCFLALISVPAYATETVVSQINVIKDLVLGIITAIGAIVLAWGVFELAFSYQSHDTSQQTAALKKVVSGIIMVAAPIIIGALGG